MPHTILKTMARALPVVATDVGGIRDVIDDGHNRRLVHASDQPKLVDAPRELIARPEQRARLGGEAPPRPVACTPGKRTSSVTVRCSQSSCAAEDPPWAQGARRTPTPRGWACR